MGGGAIDPDSAESVSLRRMLDTLDASLTHRCNVSDEFLTNVYRGHGSFVNMPGVQIFRSSCKILVDRPTEF